MQKTDSSSCVDAQFLPTETTDMGNEENIYGAAGRTMTLAIETERAEEIKLHDTVLVSSSRDQI